MTKASPQTTVIPSRLTKLAGVLTATFGRSGAANKPTEPMNLKGLKAPPFDFVKVVRAALPPEFRAFEAEEITEARALMVTITKDWSLVMELVDVEIRRQYRADHGAPTDMPLNQRLAQAQVIRSAAKQRCYANRARLAELLKPGLTRAGAAVQKAALEYAEAERSTADRLGVEWQPSCIVCALAASVERLRDRAEAGGQYASLGEATFGLIE